MAWYGLRTASALKRFSSLLASWSYLVRTVTSASSLAFWAARASSVNFFSSSKTTTLALALTAAS